MKTLTYVTFLIQVLILIGCGRVEEQSTTQQSVTCKKGFYMEGSGGVEFRANDVFVVDTGWCVSSGTYTCDADTGAVSINIDAQEGPGTGLFPCVNTGSYSCSVAQWNTHTFGGQVQLKCNTNTYLNVTKTFTFDFLN